MADSDFDDLFADVDDDDDADIFGHGRSPEHEPADDQHDFYDCHEQSGPGPDEDCQSAGEEEVNTLLEVGLLVPVGDGGVPKAGAEQESAFGSGDAKDRSRAQHLLLAATGRAAKFRKILHEQATQQAEAIQAFVSESNAWKGSRAPKLVCRSGGQRAFGLRLEVGHSASKNSFVLSWRDMLHLGFAQTGGRQRASEFFGVACATVRRTLTLVADVVLERQLWQLSELVRHVRAHPPDFAVSNFAWDETSELLTLPALDCTTRAQQRSTWQVCVSKLQFALGWVAGPKVYHEVVMPPIPLATNAAKHLYCGLHLHPLLKPIQELRQQLALSARLRAHIHEVDGHLANQKLHYFKYGQECEERVTQKRSAVYTEMFLCRNHQVNLVMTCSVHAAPRSEDAGGALLNNLFCTTLFLRMGGHFMRLIAGVKLLVASMLEWIPNPSADQLAGVDYGSELADYLADNLHMSAREMARVNRGGCDLYIILTN